MTGFVLDASSETARNALSELRAQSEHLVFFLLERVSSDSANCAAQVVLDKSHFSRTMTHVELSDSGRAHLLRTATCSDGWLVEMHSHGHYGDPAEFSLTDRKGLASWVQHLRWRLPGRGYVAVVLGEATVDGLVWLPDTARPRPLSALQVSAGSTWKTTERSYATWIKEAR